MPRDTTVEPKVGIEPTTYALPRRCSTSEPLGPGRRTGKWYPMTGCGEAPDPPTPILRQVDRHRQRRAEARRRGACERGLGGTEPGPVRLRRRDPHHHPHPLTTPRSDDRFPAEGDPAVGGAPGRRAQPASAGCSCRPRRSLMNRAQKASWNTTCACSSKPRDWGRK